MQTPHTDLGSLAILFTTQAGLQTLLCDRTAEAWEFVASKRYCAVVNIGNALPMMTGGVLTSGLHYVGPLSGRPTPTRYPFGYLQGPEQHIVLRVPGVDGATNELQSREWLRGKFGMLRKDTYTHDQQ